MTEERRVSVKNVWPFDEQSADGNHQDDDQVELGPWSEAFLATISPREKLEWTIWWLDTWSHGCRGHLPSMADDEGVSPVGDWGAWNRYLLELAAIAKQHGLSYGAILRLKDNDPDQDAVISESLIEMAAIVVATQPDRGPLNGEDPTAYVTQDDIARLCGASESWVRKRRVELGRPDRPSKGGHNPHGWRKDNPLVVKFLADHGGRERAGGGHAVDQRPAVTDAGAVERQPGNEVSSSKHAPDGDCPSPS